MHFVVVDLLFLFDGGTERAGTFSKHIHSVARLWPSCLLMRSLVSYLSPSLRNTKPTWNSLASLLGLALRLCLCLCERKEEPELKGGRNMCSTVIIYIRGPLSQSNRLFCGPLVWKEGVPLSWCLLLTERDFPEHCSCLLTSFLNHLRIWNKGRRSMTHVHTFLVKESVQDSEHRVMSFLRTFCTWLQWAMMSSAQEMTASLPTNYTHFYTTCLGRGNCVWDTVYCHTWTTCSVCSLFVYTVVITCCLLGWVSSPGLCSVFQVEHSFNYLEIQGISCNKPTQVQNVTV